VTVTDMTPHQRLKFESLVRALTGLELWLIGESELPKTAEDDFCRLSARLGIYQSILWPEEEADGDGEVQCQVADPDQSSGSLQSG